MKTLFLSLVLQFALVNCFSQVLLNEASNSNYNQIADGDNDYPDWIELYNAGSEQNMAGYFLSDSKSNLNKWPFPAMAFSQNQRMLLFASGKYSTDNTINHWETAVIDNDTWKWLNPDATTPGNWKDLQFDDSGWTEGQGGFGFSDDDDVTVFPNTNLSIYTRINFSIADTSIIQASVLHMDYDDGFVAYLNGQEIARSNVSGVVNWNTPSDNTHEAVMYQGQNPEEFRLDMELVKSVWVQGNNVLAVHAMNQSLESSDITCRAFLSFGIENSTQLFNAPPTWFNLLAAMGTHTNFKIDGKGETIYLSNASGIQDSLVIPQKMPLNSSYGRTQDGVTSFGIFLISTPGTTNNSQTAYTIGLEEVPTIDKTSGFYPAAIFVTMSTSSAGAEIRYTLDGQTPLASSLLYTTPIAVNANSVLSARSFSSTGKLPSETVINSFFIGETQTNAGILSITTDNENLFGPSGIYDNWWTDLKKPCYIEYYAPDNHELAFKQRAGLRIDGGAGGSRSQPQRSFRLEPGNGTLGDGAIQYPLQPFRPNREEYETFYLRNGSNQYLYYPCKDAIQTKCMAYGTDVPYSEYTPVQVYLNGQYWGMYELREKQDADFFLQHYGIEKESLELLSASYWYGGVLRSVEGKDAVQHFNDDYSAVLNLSTSSQSYWDNANLHFDLPAYIDYICMQAWIGNVDWPYNNIKIFRGPQTNNKWRYGLIDLEWSMQPNGWTDSNFDHINFMMNYSTDYPYLHLWQKSIENSTFKAKFINRFADLMNTNWHIDSLRAIANRIYSETRPELPRQFQRWGDSSNVFGQMATFDDAHQTMLNELSNRSAEVSNHILTNFNLPKQVTITLDVVPQGAGKIKISTVKPSVYPWTGKYFDGVPVSIEAIANAGFTFVNWDTNSLITSLSNSVFSDTLTSSVTFRANFQTDVNGNTVTISEINYNSAKEMDAEDWVEFWNYSESNTMDISGWYFSDEETIHRYTFPANTRLPAGTGIIVVNDSEKFAAIYPAVSHLGNFDFKFGNSGDEVRLYDINDNLIAQVVYDDQDPWPIEADGTGKTLERISPTMPVVDALSWFAGCVGGSPGFAFDSPCSVTAIGEEPAQYTCMIYPNPTQGKFILSSSIDPLSIWIMDVSGKVQYTTTEATLNHEIDLTDYPQGIYLVKVVLKNSTQQMLKVVKY